MGIYRSLVKQAIDAHLGKWLKALRIGKVKVALETTVGEANLRLIIKSANEKGFRAQLTVSHLADQRYFFHYLEFEDKTLRRQNKPPIRI